jgi:hypothetical protein
MIIISNELRILNLVNYQEGTSKKQGTIYCLNYNNCTLGDHFTRDTVKYSNLEPILLTEEWLLKFGFQFYFIGNGDYKSKQWYFEDFTLCGFNYYYNLEINYIHQLQNLFFAIKGKELIYNNGDNKENIQMD